LLAYIATAKYADALPLYRQVSQFARLGVELDRTTLANWMVKCGELVQPLINRLTELILEPKFRDRHRLEGPNHRHSASLSARFRAD